MLSPMSFRDADAFVPGINDLVNGNPNTASCRRSKRSNGAA